MIYLDLTDRQLARAEFDRLFDLLDQRETNQRIFDAVKLGKAPQSRARLIDAKPESHNLPAREVV